MAEEISFPQVYKEVFHLYGVNWNKQLDDIILSMKKLDYNFTIKEFPDADMSIKNTTKGFKEYIECLTEAHNQMLYLVQDPRNKYPIMEENPLHSKDVLYGVPTVFKEILNGVVETLAKNNEEVFKLQVLQMKEESFMVEPIHEVPIIEDNVSEEPFRINEESEEFSPIKVGLP